MRAYSAEDEEALRARSLLKDWAGEGFLTAAQQQEMEQETVCELRRTNVYLRLVLFFFTLILVGASVGLLFLLVGRPAERSAGIMLMVCAAAAYAAAEAAVGQGRLYRHGIEEALLVCSTGLLCLGVLSSFSLARSLAEFMAAAAGAIFSLWIWHRFGLPYFCLIAMVFGGWLPDHWSASPVAHHLAVVALYGVSLLAVVATRARHRFTCLDRHYSIAEALLWLGIYLALNLQVRTLVNWLWMFAGANMSSEASKPFYWATWVLIWCLPPVVLMRGLRQKDRFVMAAGSTMAMLTLATNKLYLGWPRHTWDPMLLGVLLVTIAVVARRWLIQGPNEVRQGFTARRLSGSDKAWLDTTTTAFGVASQNSTPAGRTGGSDVRFGGGDFGGGGASSDW